jgi:hypothetical protein
VVRTVASITSPIAGQLDPGTGGSNVYPLTFKAPDKNGFSTAEQDGGLGLAFDPTKPWIIRLGTSPGQFNTLTDGDVLDCHLLVKYTLS